MLTLFRDLFAPPRHLILLALSAWLGLTLAERTTEQRGISKETLNNLVFYGLSAYIVGGRLLFAATHLSVFVKSPLSLLSPNADLFDPLSAALAAILAGFIYGQRQRLPLWPALDSLTPFFATVAIGLSLTHLAAGTAFGAPTSLPWGIKLWNATRHPTQIYEFTASLLTLILLWRKRPVQRPGFYFLTFTALTSAWRLIIDGFRGDSILVFGGFRQSQALAWLVLALSLTAFELMQRRPPTENPAKEN